MKHTLLYLFGTALLLLESTGFAAEPTYYQFPAGSCQKLENSTWSRSEECGERGKTYEIDGALDSFCLYQLMEKEPLERIAKRLGYLRPLENTRLSFTNTGTVVTSSFIRAGAKLLFYRGDILRSNNKNLCRRPSKADMHSSFYALSYPASFYVMRTALKRVDIEKEDHFDNELDRIIAAQPSITTTKFSKDNKMSIQLGLFYESFEGEQISNGSKAEILNELSPSINANVLLDVSKRLKLAFSVGADLHQFDDRAGQLEVENESVISFSLSTNLIYKMNSRVSLFAHIAGVEDLYYLRKNPTSLEIKKDIVPRFGFGLDLALIKYRNLSLSISPIVFYDLEGSAFESGFGYNAPVSIQVLNDSYNLNAKVGYGSRNKELTDLELDYKRYYLELTVGFDI